MMSEIAIQGVSRRTFLTQAALAGAYLLLSPASSGAAAQWGNQRNQAVVQVLNDAVRTSDMKGAIQRHGKALSREDRNVLLSLSPAELAALSSFRRRLVNLGVKQSQ
ncbi:MAG: twin-arginine translocation signal domain-containing protein [Thermodesulfovibrionales bacterium]